MAFLLLILLFFSGCVYGAWDFELITSPTRLHSPRAHVQAVHDPDAGFIYLIGGLDEHGSRISDVLRYSISKDEIDHRFTNPDLNRRTGGSAVRVRNGSIYYIGGYDEHGLSAEINLLNGSFNMERAASLLFASVDAKVVWDQHETVHIIGGERHSGLQGRVERLHLPTGSVDAPFMFISPRSMAASVYNPAEHSIYIFGGFTMGLPNALLIERYDVETGFVEPLRQLLPLEIVDPCAVWTGGNDVYILGGGTSNGLLYNFLHFDLRSNLFTRMQVKDFEFVLEAPGCAFVHTEMLSRIYIFGGRRQEGLSDNIWWIDLEDRGPLPTLETQPPPTSPEAGRPPTSTEGFPASSTSTNDQPSSDTGNPVPSTSVTSEDPSSTEQSVASTPEEPITPTTQRITSTTQPIPSTTEQLITSTTITSTTTQSPPVDSFDCSATDRHGLLFQANASQTATHSCPRNAVGVATWFCMAPDNFNGSHPDYSNCSSKWIQDLIEEFDGLQLNATFAGAVLEIIHDHVNPAMNSSMYFGHEIRILFKITNRVLELVENSTALKLVEELTSAAFFIYDLLFTFMDPWEELTEYARAVCASSCIITSGSMGLRLGNWGSEAGRKTYRNSFTNFGHLNAMSGSEETKPAEHLFSQRISFPEEYDEGRDSFIRIRRNWASYFPGVEQVSFAGVSLSAEYVNIALPASRLKLALQNSSRSRIVNGDLMSFTFDDPSFISQVNSQNTSIVRISVQHDVYAWGEETTQVRRRLHIGERPKAVSSSAKCVYWDPDLLVWSTDGCWLVSTGRDVTTCECNHLTSFAVIMDLHDYVGKDFALELLTLILCSLSIVCLLGSLLVFGINRQAKKLLTSHPRHDLTRNLCLTLLVTNVLILATMDKHYMHLSDGVCTAAAMVLHYFLLLAFAWMALEGILLAKLVFINVFSTGKEYKKFEKAAAFLMPAVIVGVTCAVNFIRGDHGYGNDAFCWLDGYYLWSFMGAIAPVLLFNMSVLVMSIRKSRLAQQGAGAIKYGKFPGRQRQQSAGFWIRGALSLTVIMGLTWVFGFIMLVNNYTFANIAAYLFTIFNASQGIFIFVFHVACNGSVRAFFGCCWVSHSESREKLGSGSISTSATPADRSR